MHSEYIEEYRDRLWRRAETLRVQNAEDVERMVNEIGFCLALTDSRTNLPSVYLAVCGRRDAVAPKNVQKDEECSLAWVLKDEVMRRGNVYYSKLSKGRAMFVRRDLIPAFRAVYGLSKSAEKNELSKAERAIMKVLRAEWESSSSDLRSDAKIEDRKSFTKSLENLQRMMKVIPYEVLYQPKFTYLWTLPEARFPDEYSGKMSRDNGLYKIAEAYLQAYGMTLRGEFSRSIGFQRKEAGAAFHRLVDDGKAVRVSEGVYCLPKLAALI
ncbi:MAG: hypothetical protein R2684_14635 [Pyrinomonadaceae bacterium]